jgi:hypothetical protein
VDAAAELAAEHAVDEPVLSDAAEAAERRRRDDGIEVMTVPGHGGPGTWNPGLDTRLELFGGYRLDRHGNSVAGTHGYTE